MMLEQFLFELTRNPESDEFEMHIEFSTDGDDVTRKYAIPVKSWPKFHESMLESVMDAVTRHVRLGEQHAVRVREQKEAQQDDLSKHDDGSDEYARAADRSTDERQQNERTP